MKKIIDVKGLNVYFPSSKQKKELVHIVRDVDFSVMKNQIVGFIGESGSGKSVTAKSLLGINSNSVTKAKKMNINGTNVLTPKNILSNSKRVWKKIRGNKVAYIPQDSLTSLNPTKKVGKQIIEALKLHSSDFIIAKSKEARKKYEIELQKLKLQNADTSYAEKRNVDVEKVSSHKVNNKPSKIVLDKEIKQLKLWAFKPYEAYAIDILEKFGIAGAADRLKSYPHQFSGGMRQRVVIAMMVACRPDVIIADEPTTALDPTVQASVMKLFQDIIETTDTSIILISHDIAVIAKVCDYLYIYYAGAVVEKGTKKDIFVNPQHPYTWSLLSAIPDSSISKKGKKLFTIAGQPPTFDNLPKGDPFSVRNPFAMQIDFKQEAPLFRLSDTHYAATWLIHPSAPKVKIPEQVETLIKITSKEFKNAK